ncbi:hypothetical protein A2U01_0097411, partial [Trifolium medium]|nr:hypothetical protein [Trifolium medium]
DRAWSLGEPCSELWRACLFLSSRWANDFVAGQGARFLSLKPETFRCCLANSR